MTVCERKIEHGVIIIYMEGKEINFALMEHVNDYTLERLKAKDDMTKFYLQHRGFGAWYYLQHYVGFHGKYQPFINRIDLDYSIGEISS